MRCRRAGHSFLGAGWFLGLARDTAAGLWLGGIAAVQTVLFCVGIASPLDR